MAKANVLARRIRAYDRRVEELGFWVKSGATERRDAARMEAKWLQGLRAEAVSALDAWLATRTAGPWMAYANADEAAAA